MNDFTKEELYKLQWFLDNFPICNQELEESWNILQSKIQSMIDNYQEICELCNRKNCEGCPCR